MMLPNGNPKICPYFLVTNIRTFIIFRFFLVSQTPKYGNCFTFNQARNYQVKSLQFTYFCNIKKYFTFILIK